MKTILVAATALMCMAGSCAGAPPRRHVYWDRPHSSLPSWYPPEGPTWIQKVYYTLTSHFGSAIAAGFGSFFGLIGPFVSSFSQPYFSTYVSRLTGDVVARSLSDASAPQLDNILPIPDASRSLAKAEGFDAQGSSYNDVFEEELTEGAKDFDDLARGKIVPILLKDKLYDDSERDTSRTNSENVNGEIRCNDARIYVANKNI